MRWIGGGVLLGLVACGGGEDGAHTWKLSFTANCDDPIGCLASENVADLAPDGSMIVAVDGTASDAELGGEPLNGLEVVRISPTGEVLARSSPNIPELDPEGTFSTVPSFLRVDDSNQFAVAWVSGRGRPSLITSHSPDLAVRWMVMVDHVFAFDVGADGSVAYHAESEPNGTYTVVLIDSAGNQLWSVEGVGDNRDMHIASNGDVLTLFAAGGFETRFRRYAAADGFLINQRVINEESNRLVTLQPDGTYFKYGDSPESFEIDLLEAFDSDDGLLWSFTGTSDESFMQPPIRAGNGDVLLTTRRGLDASVVRLSATGSEVSRVEVEGGEVPVGGDAQSFVVRPELTGGFARYDF